MVSGRFPGSCACTESGSRCSWEHFEAPIRPLAMPLMGASDTVPCLAVVCKQRREAEKMMRVSMHAVFAAEGLLSLGHRTQVCVCVFLATKIAKLEAKIGVRCCGKLGNM